MYYAAENLRMQEQLQSTSEEIRSLKTQIETNNIVISYPSADSRVYQLQSGT